MKVVRIKEQVNPISVLALTLIHIYQWLLSPFLGSRCRFYPSCSNYAEHCFRFLPPTVAAILTSKRLLRCQPSDQGGFHYPPGYKQTISKVDSVS